MPLKAAAVRWWCELVPAKGEAVKMPDGTTRSEPRQQYPLFSRRRGQVAFRGRRAGGALVSLAAAAILASSVGGAVANGSPARVTVSHSGSSSLSKHAPSLSKLVQELASCIHHHGAPNFPDPHIDAQGQVAFPPNAPDLPPDAQRACQWIINQLPNPGNGAPPPVSLATYQKWLRFAQCMRTHGLPTWPDPDRDGSFPLPPALTTAPSSAIAPAFGACRRLDPNPNGKYTISGSRS